MSNSIFLADKDKLNLSKDDLFDRVINLKLSVSRNTESEQGAVVKNTETFIVRSDYEAVFTKQSITNVMRTGNFTSDTYYIRKCAYKPSIKFTSKKISGTSSVELDIYVSNFLIYTNDGKCLATFNSKDYNLVGVEVLMGYWGQFKNAPHRTIEDLFRFEPMFGADKIVMNSIKYVTTDKLAPDFTLHIHGYISSVLNPPLATQEVKTFDAISNSGLLETYGNADRKSDLSKLFFNHITRRFLRQPTVNAAVNKKINARKPLSDFEAINYGIQVYTSEGIDKIKIPKRKDNEGNEVDTKVYFNTGYSPDSTLIQLGELTQTKFMSEKLNNGNILVFTNEESQDRVKLAEQFQKYNKDTVFNKVYNDTLPAVYNISIEATAMIVCPFFAFINPFQEVKFKSRYSVSTLTAYFTGLTTDKDTFIATNVQISFATVENINEMQITCVTKGK